MPAITVNFDSRVASITASALVFGSGTGPQDQIWALPAGSGPITIVPGSGGFFLIQGQGTNGQGGWNCSGGGCAGATQVQGKAAGIFFGPVGDHAGVTLAGNASNSSGTNVANFGTVRVFCKAGLGC
jgi:hypothetical protein